ncbi:hypothetical protein V7654_13680 [Bacillus sp. JJ1609]|uniref:hypothetical protein n=1 Tax=Bacillus sp. JJ1609 TaxID=3122977 RepID=UPI002FFF9819
MSYKLYGAIGFGVGGLIAGLAGDYMILAFIFFGLIGSAVLSIPARDIKLTILSSLLGAIGFFFGFTIPMFVVLGVLDLGLPFVGLIMGFFGGGLLGYAYKNIQVFIVAGMIGFGIWGFFIDILRPFYTAIHPAIVMMIASALAGAILGYAANTAKRADHQ